MQINKIYNEDCLDTMRTMPKDFIDLVITSPPYGTLRVYNGFSFYFKPIVNALYRVIKRGGVVVWVVGDATINGSETGMSFQHALHFMSVGFRLHDTMIYLKSGAAFPAGKNSVRYSQTFEYMFVFSKGKPKTINLLKDKPNRWAGHASFGTQTNRQKDGTLKEKKKRTIGEFGYRNNVWKLDSGERFGSSDKIAKQHPAIFPEALVDGHIKTWSNIGDLVYDPMMGSGTVAKVALLNDRNFIGSEISNDYCKIATARLREVYSEKRKM